MSAADDPLTRKLAEARALRELGRPRDAAAAYASAIATDPESADAHTGLAAAEIEQHHFDRARDAAKRALAIDAESEWAYRLLALAQLRLNTNELARDAALKAVECAPGFFQSYIVLAEALLATGDRPGARAAAARAVELAPESSAAHQELARILLETEGNKASERSSREALRLNPQNAIAMNNLAVAISRQGRKREAVPIYEQAARLDPNQGTVRKNLRRIANSSRAGHLSAPTRQLLADEAQASNVPPRESPRQAASRYRPWWWVLLKRMNAPEALLVNVAVVVLGLLLATSHGHGTLIVWPVLFALAIPFSVRRAWRWWRLRHPSRNSWRPTQVYDPAPPTPQPTEPAD